MVWYKPNTWFASEVNEELKQFKKLDNDVRKPSEYGEGYENPLFADAGLISQQFHDKYLYQKLDNKVSKINEYRRIAMNSEVSDVIEDAVIESTQTSFDNDLFTFEIKDEKLAKNKNAVTNLTNEFKEFVYNRLELHNNISNYFEDFYIDGELYLENVIDENNKQKGILYWKKLPTETMDFIYNYQTSHIDAFLQYLKMGNNLAIRSIEDARNNKDVVLFNPAQICYINYGKFNPTDRTKIFGYLEKARKAFNQLTMLETSVIIYRLVRAPERFVFTIDVGNMPRDKAMKFVEKMKQKMTVKQSFDPETGLLKNASNVMSMADNFFLPTSSSGRGSQISTIGGNPTGFTELDDIYYFQKKLFKALKYPISRVQNVQEGNSGDSVFGGQTFGDIPRDEVKWSTFLEAQQIKFCNMLLKSFLIHLEFKGFKKQYGLDNSSLYIEMQCPNSFRDQIQQKLLQQKMDNYQNLVNNEEFSKIYLMKRFLDMDDDEIKKNAEGFKQDKEILPKQEEEY